MSKKQTVLHVEDDDSVAYLLQRALEQECFCYERAVNVEEAIAYIGNVGHLKNTTHFQQPDIIIVDLALANGKNAPEFIVWLRHHPQHRHTPIIVLTSAVEPEMEERLMRAGANAFMMKGLGLDELLVQLRAIFQECGVR